MLHRIITIIETLEEIRYEITGNQKLQEKQTTANDSHRSIVKKPIQDKIRRLWCLRRKIEGKSTSKIKIERHHYNHEYSLWRGKHVLIFSQQNKRKVISSSRRNLRRKVFQFWKSLIQI